MYRKKRATSRPVEVRESFKETARLLDKAIREAGVPLAEREDFLKWTVDSLWQSFRSERMNQRIIIENEIKALGIHLPNGTVKTDYSSTFSLPLDKISDVRLEGAEALGLTLIKSQEDDTFTLCGRPLKAGDFSLKVTYATVPGEPRSQLSIPIAFNPDPRSLWRDIPTDKNIPYPKPDTVSEYVKVEAGFDGSPKKDMAAASRRGRSHAQEGKARDDHFTIFHCPASDWYIMAVADGAGSARYSRKGSEVACDTVVEHCRERLTDNLAFENAIKIWQLDPDNREKRTAVTRSVIDIIYNGALKAYEAIKRTAFSADGGKLRDYATTLMFVVCKKFSFGWFLASFWVGDGAMCLFDAKRKTAKLLGTPDEGEFSGQTRFITMHEIFRDPDMAAKRLRMAVVSDFTALFLMTDGVSDPMFETEKNLNDYAKWEEFYKKLQKGFPDDEIGGVDLSDDNSEAAGQLLEWLNFWSPGNHDDRTIAMLY